LGRGSGSFARAAIAFGVIPALYSLTMWAMLRSPAPRADYGGPVLTGVALAFSAAVMWVGRPVAREALERAFGRSRAWGGAAVALAAALTFLVCATVGRVVLDGFPVSADELAYIFQAQTYAEGRLWADPPPMAAALQFPHLWNLNGKWVSQYLPGWSIVMTPAAVLGAPLWLVNPLLGAATVGVFFALARQYVTRETAWTGLAVLAASAFFLMTYGSYFNHGLTTLAGLAFALFGCRYGREGRVRDALLAGACIGVMGLTRPQNALVFAAPFVVFLVLAKDRRAGLFWFGLGGAPFLAALLAYDAAITGNPFKPVQAMMVHEPVGIPTTEGFKRVIQRLFRLPEWTSPVLFFGWAAAWLVALRRRSFDFTDWIMPATFVALLFYGGQGGPQYGSRYFFEAWPFAILTILKVTEPLLKDGARPALASWISAGLLAIVTLQLAYIPPRMAREHDVIKGAQAPYLATAHLEHALVVFREGVDFRQLIAADFLRNTTHVERQDVIYALDLGPRNKDLLAAYPGRTLFLWDGRALSRLNPATGATPKTAPEKR
jgi:hypothetical protein